MIKRKYFLYKLGHSTDLDECFKWFEDLLSQMKFVKINDEFIFAYFNSKLIMFYQHRYANLWIKYDNIITIFLNKYFLNYNDIKFIISKMINMNIDSLSTYDNPFIWFDELLDLMFIKKDKNRIVFYLENELVMIQDNTKDFFMVDYDTIWYYFQNAYSLEYTNIQNIIILTINNKYNIEIQKPVFGFDLNILKND